MKSVLCLLCLIFLGCSANENEQQLSLENLCDYSFSNTTGKNCSSDFLLHINSKTGDMKHSEELGYHVVFTINKSYDCTILGVICKGDYSDFVGSTVNLTADIHEYTHNSQPSVGGQKIVSLNNLSIN